jgi:hypothetical protein
LSGNSWQRDNATARGDGGGGGRSQWQRATLAALGSCAVFVSACDVPAPATARPEPTPPAERGKPAAVASAIEKTQTATAAPSPEKTPADKTTSPPPTAVTKTVLRTDSLITASATADRSKLHAGETFTIRVDVQIESGWHIYAIDRPTGPSIPTSINFELPKTLAWDGDWTGSEPTLDDAHPDEPSFIYAGSASFSRRLRVAQAATPGAVTLRGSLHYQACDKFSCRAPTRERLETKVTIVP